MNIMMFTSLCLILSILGFTHQFESANTLLRSLQNNPRTTITLNSTTLRINIDLSNTPGYIRKQDVSFSVSVKGKELKLGSGQTIIYNHVLANDGNGYDDSTGVFTCPVAGTYMFVVDALSPGPTSLHLHLNKTKVASLHVSDYHKKGYLQMSRTIVLKVKKGDRISVVNHAYSSGALYHEGYSGFSGIKVY